MWTPSDWIAVAAIVAGGVVALVGPWVASVLQARREHRQRLLDARIKVYADVLDLATQLYATAEWRIIGPEPTGAPEEPSTDELRRANATTRLVGDDEARAAVDRFSRAMIAFNVATLQAPRTTGEDGVVRYSQGVDISREFQEVADSLKTLERAMRADIAQTY